MRILLISWNYSPKLGGMETMLQQLVESLQHQCEVDVIGPYAKHTPVSDKDSVIRPQRDGLFWFFMAAFVIGWRLLRQREYDFVMAGSALVIPTAYLLGRLFNCRVAVQVHGLDIIYNQFWYQQMIRFLLPRCDLIFANSQQSKQFAVARRVAGSKIKVINPGIHSAEFATVPDMTKSYRRYNLNDRHVILSAGRLAPRKGVAEFVWYVMPELVRVFPDVLFVVVGDNPTDSLAHTENVRLKIEKTVDALHLQKNVLLLGRVDRDTLVQLYHACHLFVLPAIDIPGDMEGFGIVLLEAGAASKPVVSTQLGGIPDAVVNGRSGILLEAGDWAQMTQTIVDLLTDDNRREAIGQFGRNRVQTELDWLMVGQKYLKELQNECK